MIWMHTDASHTLLCAHRHMHVHLTGLRVSLGIWSHAFELSLTYLISQSPEDRSPNKNSFGTKSQGLEDVRAFSHTSIQEHLHLPLHSLHDFRQDINLGERNQEHSLAAPETLFIFWASSYTQDPSFTAA